MLLNSRFSLQPDEQTASSKLKPRSVEVGLGGLRVLEAGIVRSGVWAFLSVVQFCADLGDTG